MKKAPSHENAHTVGRALTLLALGGVAATAAIIVAPHILPELGIGTAQTFSDTMWVSHNYVAGEINQLAITEAGSGLAGFINRGMATIPLIGEKLAAGGWFNALVAGGTGISGLIIGHKMQKDGKSHAHIKWGKIIKYAALAASALIAMPTLLNGLTMGITYLAMLTGNNALIDGVVSTVNHTLGVSGGKMGAGLLGFSGLAAVLPHLLTCGMSLLPAILTLREIGKDNKSEQAHAPKTHITIDQPTAAGIKTHGLLTLQHADGSALTEDDLKTVHTQKLHLLITDSSLSDYHHLHPETVLAGSYRFTFTPKTNYPYAVWADMTTTDGKNHRIKTSIPAKARQAMRPNIKHNDEVETSQLSFDWETDAPLQQGKSSIIEVTIKDKSGKLVENLEPVMGAYAHLVGFSEDGNTLIHCHPLGVEPNSPADRGNGTLRFEITPETSGNVQFYLQIQQRGERVYVPFGQRILAPEKYAERVAAAQPNFALGY